MSIKEAEAKYVEYIKGHKQNVMEALDLLYSLEIPFVVEHFDELKDICSKHDDSKYSDEEFEPYREHFYAITDEEQLKSEAFENAVRHHIKNNKHHWDYWVDENNQLQIPDEDEYMLYTVERICDWLAMANQHEENSTDWYNANKEAIIMPEYAKTFCDDVMSKLPEKLDFSFKQTRGDLDEGFKITRGHKKYLVEANLQQLKRVALSQDPTRVKKSKNVKSTYIGISKYGVLNFKTTSEEKSGVYWYQELQFPSFNRFMNIVEQGDEVTSDDITKVLKSDNLKLFCDCPSFLYWAWKYKAYMQDYGLEKETRAPQRNNTRLMGSCCKHCLSVIDHLSDRKVIATIARDVNEWCNISLGKDKYKDPSVEMGEKEFKANQYDWNAEDIFKNYLTPEQWEEYLSGTKIADLDLTDEQYDNIQRDLDRMRKRSDFKDITPLERQFQDIRKRGRKMTRPDVKLKVNLVPKEDKSNM